MLRQEKELFCLVCPCALTMCLGSSFATILSMSSLVILTEDSLSFVKDKVGGS